jgi:beta-fructofuranosidase
VPIDQSSSAQKRGGLAAQVRADPFAPRYHFMAPEYLCAPFDPNGAIFWRGRYHLFCIFQDEALPHHGHCWGHASSADLLHWTYHPTALAPAPGDPDLGIFSGGAFVNKKGVPTIIYHGVSAGTCIATAEDDELIRWRKSPHNPVIREPREGEPGWGVYNVFDPDAWLEEDSYFAIQIGRAHV